MVGTPQSRSPNCTRPTVLVVEDDPDVRQGLYARLQAGGFHAAFTETADQALEETQRICPAAILLDLGLRGGDGFEVLRRLRALPQHIRPAVLVLSSAPRVPNEADALRAGAIAFLEKPVEGRVLIEALERICGTPERMSGAR